MLLPQTLITTKVLADSKSLLTEPQHHHLVPCLYFYYSLTTLPTFHFHVFDHCQRQGHPSANTCVSSSLRLINMCATSNTTALFCKTVNLLPGTLHCICNNSEFYRYSREIVYLLSLGVLEFESLLATLSVGSADNPST